MSENVTFLFMYHPPRNFRWVFVKVRTLGFDGFQTPLPPPLPPIRAYGIFTNDPKNTLFLTPSSRRKWQNTAARMDISVIHKIKTDLFDQ